MVELFLAGNTQGIFKEYDHVDLIFEYSLLSSYGCKAERERVDKIIEMLRSADKGEVQADD